MIFGDGLRAAPSAEPAAWLRDTFSLRHWTVGGLLPPHYEDYLLVEGAQLQEPAGDWWAAQSEIVSALAEVLTAFTGTPDRSWFAIWEGHGFGDTMTSVPIRRDVDPAEVATEMREMNHQETSVHRALAAIPRFELPDRTYYLLTGHTLDVSRIRWPAGPHRWLRPDLWWPEDRSWFVGTDVDFWCNYIGGTKAMTAAVAARFPALCRRATVDERLRVED